MSKTENPAEIYLVPVFDGEHDHVWCDTPAPGEGMREEDATRYVRADLVPASNEMLARRVVELTAERDAALAQLVEVQDNRTGKAPCERFCEALATKKMFDNLQEDNRRLRAQVEQLRDAGNDVYAELQQWALQSNHKETDAVFKAWRKARESTPAQCLAEIKARAVEDAVEATTSNKYSLPLRDACDLYEYANQLRQQAKAGE